MADTTAKQLELQRLIARALDNFKKIGKNNLTAAKVRARMTSLEKTWLQFLDGNATLVKTTPVATRASMEYFKNEVCDATADVYQETLDFMSETLEEIEPPVSPNHTLDVSQLRVAPSDLSLRYMPPINLPPFDGTLNKWEQFRDQFTAMVSDNKDLGDFARMHYLMSSVTGRARDCIGNIRVTADNFTIAWQMLEKRYESKRRLLNLHLSSLLDLPALSRESAGDLSALLDKVNLAVSSLENIPRTPEQLWSDVRVSIISKKLDPVTRKAWTVRAGQSDDLPSFNELKDFISHRARVLEEFADESAGKANAKTVVKISAANAAVSVPIACPMCKDKHLFNSCPTFVRASPTQRRELTKQYKRCFNCLSHKHSVKDCQSKYSCRVCQRKHHSMLHVPSEASASDGQSAARSSTSAVNPSTYQVPQAAAPSSEVKSLSASAQFRSNCQVLLATAWVTVGVAAGREVTVRALLDQGSEATFITDSLAQMLRAKRIRMPVSVSAVGGVHAGTCRHAAEITVSARQSREPTVKATALILKNLTTYAPKRVADISALSYLDDLPLADADPMGSEPIRMIIGADLYREVILSGLRKGEVGQPIAQKTIFGWVLSGPIGSSSSPSSASTSVAHAVSRIAVHLCLTTPSLEEAIERFWEVEELPHKVILSEDDERCENHFLATHSRAVDGRYIVRLPFKHGPPIEIGDSRHRAKKLLTSILRRLQSRPDQSREYSEFLHEYEQLGHMRRAPAAPAVTNQCVYIPHHPVLREGSVTTRLRVVFNASSVTSNGSSLNDHLWAGPKLQTELPAVILRWRQFKYVYSADIAKMYRQIELDSRDVNFQRILWTSEPRAEPSDYQLLTVTYGVNCAPFLALRVIKQLESDEGASFPLASSILRDNIYVDDVLFGGDDVSQVRQVREQLVALLRRGGFELRKWASNCVDLLDGIVADNHGLACKSFKSDENLKILGIQWNPYRDAFQFTVSLEFAVPDTKRTVLSAIAKLYDPLGWVTPVIITAKIFMQRLWREQLTWDEPIPPSLLAHWQSIYSKLSGLNEVQLSRWTAFEAGILSAELHGFADASNSAYAAVVYLRVVSLSGSVNISLLAGRSKVAPLSPLSIPRLELSAAVLLGRLLEFVRESLNATSLPCFCWSDSTVVLAWLKQHPAHWKTFVANRVADVKTRLPTAEWLHVPTEDNPADCASRGLLGDELISHSLWWSGPSWLREPRASWPQLDNTYSTEIQLEKRVVSAHCTRPPDLADIASRWSSWQKLVRVTAYILRFISRCRRVNAASSAVEPSGLALSADECSAARIFWIKKIQAELFSAEILSLSKGQRLSAKSSILSLRPFLDRDGLLRVGGRLRNAPIPLAMRQPILLAAHPLVSLIIHQAHQRTLHAGLQLTMSILRRDFWILRARGLVRHLIHKCVACTRERAAIPAQLMGDLPAVRVTASGRSFQHCGLDYAGPVFVRASAGRGITSRKAYIALFVCLATRAIHIELVSDYTSSAFTNAYARFCARRGLPQAMYSDNGTTFVGADKELASAYRKALRDPNFLNLTAGDDVAWHFLPPSAPHFGGIWEAGVKSVKHHLRRVLGDHKLTFEELTTLLCRVEACLNSRPIAPLSDTLDDYEPLTPGHFLIGSAMTVAPEPSLLTINENRLSRWQLVRQLTERFWKVWYDDYVNTLQQRKKWRTEQPAVRIGQLVLLRNSLLPPCKWELGRVTQCHPGADGLTRVVTVKTAASEYRRPIVQICLLPVDCETPKQNA